MQSRTLECEMILTQSGSESATPLSCETANRLTPQALPMPFNAREDTCREAQTY